MQHMNADSSRRLLYSQRRFARIEAQEAEMTSVDRLGFLGFLREVPDPLQTREVFVEMVQQTRLG